MKHFLCSVFRGKCIFNSYHKRFSYLQVIYIDTRSLSRSSRSTLRFQYAYLNEKCASKHASSWCRQMCHSPWMFISDKEFSHFYSIHGPKSLSKLLRTQSLIFKNSNYNKSKATQQNSPSTFKGVLWRCPFGYFWKERNVYLNSALSKNPMHTL